MISTTATVTAYRFADLSAAAQRRVFDDWDTEEERRLLYQNDVDDLDAALHSFLELIGYEPRWGSRSGWYRYGNLEYIGFDSVDFYEARENVDKVDDYSGCGLWCGYDLAKAWNDGAPEMLRLLEKVEQAEEEAENEEPDEDGRRFGCYAVMDAQADFCRWYEKVLADVAAAYNKLLEGSFDYWLCGQGMAEYWNEGGECELVTADRWYNADGEDVTGIVDEYGREPEPAAFRAFDSVYDVCAYLDWWNYARAAETVRSLVDSGAVSEPDVVAFAHHVAPDWVDGDEFARLLSIFAQNRTVAA